MIINVSNTRSRLARLIELVLTAIAWLIFGFLLYRGLFASPDSGAAPRPMVPDALQTLHTVSLYLVVALINAAILFAWAMYNQVRFRGRERRGSIGEASDHQLAQSYQVETATIQQLRTGKSTIIHHDAHGSIAFVEPRAGMVSDLTGRLATDLSHQGNPPPASK